LRPIWKQTLYLLLALLLVVGAFSAAAVLLGTQAPLAAVTSGSMTPTIKQGDLLVIQGVSPQSLQVGNIIVYRTTDPYLSDELIVHRIIQINKADGNIVGFVTKGDNNPYPDTVYGFEPPTGIPPQYVVGKVVFVIPLLGFIVLFLKQPGGLALMVVLLGIVVFWGIIDDRQEGERRSASTKWGTNNCVPRYNCSSKIDCCYPHSQKG
jgi:signal peptidase I